MEPPDERKAAKQFVSGFKSELSRLFEELQCPVCQSLPSEPVTFPSCLHSSCRNCFEQAQNSDRHNKDEVQCPFCREKAPRRGVRQNELLTALAEETQALHVHTRRQTKAVLLTQDAAARAKAKKAKSKKQKSRMTPDGFLIPAIPKNRRKRRVSFELPSERKRNASAGSTSTVGSNNSSSSNSSCDKLPLLPTQVRRANSEMRRRFAAQRAALSTIVEETEETREEDAKEDAKEDASGDVNEQVLDQVEKTNQEKEDHEEAVEGEVSLSESDESDDEVLLRTGQNLGQVSQSGSEASDASTTPSDSSDSSNAQSESSQAQSETSEAQSETQSEVQSEVSDEDDDDLCHVCFLDGELLLCDGCDLAVHQDCYYVTKVPSGSWFCRVCRHRLQHEFRLSARAIGRLDMEAKKNAKLRQELRKFRHASRHEKLQQYRCGLCANTADRALMQSDSGRSDTAWVHVSCALWITGCRFVTPDKPQHVTGVSDIAKSQWHHKCCFCQEKRGVVVGCEYRRCRRVFHIPCAPRADPAGMLELRDVPGGPFFHYFCDRHCDDRSRATVADDNTARAPSARSTRRRIKSEQPSVPARSSSVKATEAVPEAVPEEVCEERSGEPPAKKRRLSVETEPADDSVEFEYEEAGASRVIYAVTGDRGAGFATLERRFRGALSRVNVEWRVVHEIEEFEEVTHLVVTGRHRMLLNRTAKYMAALLRGVWILQEEWMHQVARHGPQDARCREALFEMSGDTRALQLLSLRRHRLQRQQADAATQGQSEAKKPNSSALDPGSLEDMLDDDHDELDSSDDETALDGLVQPDTDELNVCACARQRYRDRPSAQRLFSNITVLVAPPAAHRMRHRWLQLQELLVLAGATVFDVSQQRHSWRTQLRRSQQHDDDGARRHTVVAVTFGPQDARRWRREHMCDRVVSATQFFDRIATLHAFRVKPEPD